MPRVLPPLRRLRRRLSRPAELPEVPGPDTLRVLTYNTHHGADRAGRASIEQIADTVARWRPDVVALQEVDRRWGARSQELDQPAWYAERLGMAAHFGANVGRAGDDAAGYGLVLLSRLPLVEPRHRLYSRPPAEPRGLLRAVVAVPAFPRPVRVTTTHLSVRAPRRRAVEVEQLLADADSAGDLPAVVLGDFNALTAAPAIRRMRRLYRDAWAAGRGRASTVPGRRIDYIWVSHHLLPVRTAVLRSPASDHAALVSDLVWAGAADVAGPV